MQTVAAGRRTLWHTAFDEQAFQSSLDRRDYVEFQGIACRTNHTSVVSIGQRQVAALGGYWKLQDVTVIRDGDHVAVYAGNKLIRTLDAEPGRTYQPLGGRLPATR